MDRAESMRVRRTARLERWSASYPGHWSLRRLEEPGGARRSPEKPGQPVPRRGEVPVPVIKLDS